MLLFANALTLLITLQSYYFYPLSLSLFPVFGVLGWVLLNSLEKKSLFLFTKAFFKGPEVKLIIGFSLSAILAKYFAESFFSIKPFLGFCMGCALIYCVRESKFSANKLTIASWSIHVAAWVVQFIFYYTGCGYIDFLYPVTHEHQRYEVTHSIDKYQFARLCGLFNEPSSYVLFISILALLAAKGAKTHLVSWIFGITVITCFFSFSLLGWASVFFLIMYSSTQLNSRSWALTVAASVLAIAIAMLLQHSLWYGSVRTAKRLLNINGEHSFQVRMGLKENIAMPQTENRVAPQKSWFSNSVIFLMGQGLGNESRTLSAGSSLAYCMRYLGLILFCVFSAIVIRWGKLRLLPIGIFALFMVHAPYVQHPFFWWAMGVATQSTKPKVN